MNEFTSVAKSRARYYSKGAPVQFVHVELLRAEETGEIVVTLTFKNIAPQTLTRFTAHFRCKGAQGEVIMEDDFTYDALSVPEGGLFGGDDAVYVSDVPISSVEATLVSVDYGEAMHHNLTRCQPVRLPQFKALAPHVAQFVQQRLGVSNAQYMPTTVQDGWQCACGAFNYNVGKGRVGCSECGVAKADLQAALRAAASAPAASVVSAAPVEPVYDAYNAAAPVQPVYEGYDVAAPVQPVYEDYDAAAPDPYLPVTSDLTPVYDDALPVMSSMNDTAQYNVVRGMPMEDDMDSRTQVMDRARSPRNAEVSLMSSKTADFIIKYVPFIALGASIFYVLLIMLLHMLLG